MVMKLNFNINHRKNCLFEAKKGNFAQKERGNFMNMGTLRIKCFVL